MATFTPATARPGTIPADELPETDLPIPGQAPGAAGDEPEPELQALQAEDGGGAAIAIALAIGLVVVLSNQ